MRELDELAKTAKPSSARLQAAIALTGINVDKAAALGDGHLRCRRSWRVKIPAELIQGDSAAKTRPQGSLTRELAKAEIPADVAKLALRTVHASGRESKELIAAINKAGKLGAKPPPPNPTELAALVVEVRSQGDVARGESVFRRKDLNCFKCHAIAGSGGQVGPDLSSVGASAPVDYLIESLLLPNKAVKENYHSWVVATRDGRFFTGIKARESNTELVVRDCRRLRDRGSHKQNRIAYDRPFAHAGGAYRCAYTRRVSRSRSLPVRVGQRRPGCFAQGQSGASLADARYQCRWPPANYSNDV